MQDYLIFTAEVGLVFGAGLLAGRWFNSRSWGWSSFTETSLEGKTFIVTGASSGLGYATAAQLSKQGAKVIFACRDQCKTLDKMSQIKNANKNISANCLVFKHLDLESFESVQSFVRDISSSEEVIDCVISNAGVYGPPFKLTTDGFDVQSQVNHLSPALLHLLLLDKLKEAKDSRIVVVSSTRASNGSIREADFEQNNLNNQPTYDSDKGYNNSKLYSRLFHQELASRIRQLPKTVGFGVKVFIVSPGLVYTNLFRHRPLNWMKTLLFFPVAALFMRSPHRGCQTIIEAALNPTLGISQSGQSLRNCRLVSDNHNCHDKTRVFKMTMKALESMLPQHLKTL